MKRTLVLALLLLLPNSSLPQSSPSLESRIREVIATDEYKITSWGMAVADAGTGEMLYSLNPEKLFVPGSVTKLFSGAAALVNLGSEYRFVTPVFQRGKLGGDGALEGDLIIRASGDPDLSGRLTADGHLLFTNHDHTYSGLYASQGSSAELTNTDVYAGIDDLVLKIKAAGIRSVKNILIDDRLFEHGQSGGSPPEQVNPMVVNDHLVDVTISPGGREGEPARVVIRPETSFLKFENKARTSAPGQNGLLEVREVSPRNFQITGLIAADRAPVVRSIEIEKATEFARAIFIERMRKAGIAVAADIASIPDRAQLPADDDYSKLTQVAAHSSPPFRESLKVILKVSHNNHAHMLPLLGALPKGIRTYRAAMKYQGETLSKLGVDTKSISLGDGEGGDQGDLLSPTVTIQLLKAMRGTPQYEVYRDALPLLGVDGTLADAVAPGSPARGKVSAKTGTYAWTDAMNGRNILKGKGLAGYVTAASGRQLLICLYLNNVPLKLPTDTNKHGATLGRLAEIIQQTF